MNLKSIGIALAIGGLVAASSITTPTPAEARGGRVAAGVAAGVVGGLLLGGVLANQHHGPGYYEPAPVYVEPECHTVRERYWNGYRWRWRRVRICD